MPQLDEVALTRRAQDVLARLRTITADEMGRLWLSLPDHHETAVGRWTEVASPVLEAGQNRAIDTQIAYLRALLAEDVTFDRAAALAEAQVDLREPFIALANSLGKGEELSLAIEVGRARAHAVGQSGVQWASRSAGSALDGHSRIVGWRRVLTGKSCPWCATVARQRYHSASSASFGHSSCDCTVAPIIGDRDPGRRINSEHLASRNGEPITDGGRNG